jgi:hypothetical protein
MSAPLIVLLVCAGGYVALALYGKYRNIREQFHEAQDEARRASEPPSESSSTH